jgi:hypothetical protein
MFLFGILAIPVMFSSPMIHVLYVQACTDIWTQRNSECQEKKKKDCLRTQETWVLILSLTLCGFSKRLSSLPFLADHPPPPIAAPIPEEEDTQPVLSCKTHSLPTRIIDYCPQKRSWSLSRNRSVLKWGMLLENFYK